MTGHVSLSFCMESTPKLALMHEIHCIDQGSDLKVPSTTGHVSAFV